MAAAPTGVVRIDPATNLAKTIPFGLTPNTSPLESRAIVAGAGFVWVRDSFNGQINKIDPRGLSIVGRLGLTGYPASLAADRNTVWAGFSTIDPQTNRITYRPARGTRCCLDIGLGDGWLWALPNAGVEQVFPFTGRVRKTFDINGSALAIGDGNVWVLSRIQSAVTPISEGSAQVGQPIALGGDPIAIALGDGALWIADRAGTVDRIPINGSGGVESVPVGGDPVDIAFGAGGVWVTNCGNRTVDRIDPLTRTVQKTIHLPDYPTRLAIGEGAVWVVLDAKPLGGCP